MAAVASTGLQLVGEQPDVSGGNELVDGETPHVTGPTLPGALPDGGSTQDGKGARCI
jgi:hypothetical protein